MNDEITATIEVSISDEDLSIDEICQPLEDKGWCINSAYIHQEEKKWK